MDGLELGGKRVIVTGAAGGLGRAFAEAFAAAGARWSLPISTLPAPKRRRD